MKPRLVALEACHRLAPNEGQKENKRKKREERGKRKREND
jgi:hypothetical protein